MKLFSMNLNTDKMPEGFSKILKISLLNQENYSLGTKLLLTIQDKIFNMHTKKYICIGLNFI